MGVIDRFLNAMKLNDEESFGEDDYLDEDYEEEEQEVQPKKHILKKLEEEEDEEEFIPQASVASSERTSSATRTAAKPKVVRTNPSSKISPMRQRKTGAEKSGEMEVCVIKPRSMEDAREITETLLQDCTSIFLSVSSIIPPDPAMRSAATFSVSAAIFSSLHLLASASPVISRSF